MTTATRTLRFRWTEQQSDFGLPMLWFGSWLLDGGEEGEWFYSARGGASSEHAIPEGARGVRVRCWPSEGLTPEYCDVDLGAVSEIDTATLDFTRPQPFSRLSINPEA